jgi:soluble cytochrome b562
MSANMEMLKLSLRLCLLLVFFVLAPGLHADSPLEKNMNQMRKSFRQLKMAMVAPVEADKQKYLGWVADLKAAAQASETLEPEKTSGIPTAQKTAFLEGYKNKMQELIDQFDDLGKAIEAGKWEEAKSLVGQINQVQREGHEKYRSENEGH